MKARVLLVIALGLLVAADEVKDDKKPAAKLEGTWTVTEAERDGEAEVPARQERARCERRGSFGARPATSWRA